MIGVTGAAIVGTGQFMHSRSLSNGLNNCIASGNKKESCQAKYKNPYGKLGVITLYGGCIFIVAAWIILGLVKSNLFSGIRPGGGMMMGGMGMGSMMGQYYPGM